jgi:SpoVK/Ycf46/Vps4 family AAA+-type ATPase
VLAEVDLSWRSPEILATVEPYSARRGRFFGRLTELHQLQSWIESQQQQLILLYGMKGIGKTALAQKLVESLAPKFVDTAAQHRIIWISLADAPPLRDFLSIVVKEVVGGRRSKLSQDLDRTIAKTIGCLQRQRCLFILDNADAIFGENSRSSQDLISEYTHFFDTLNSIKHQSFWLIITVAKPMLTHFNYRQIELTELDRQSCQMVIESSELTGTSTDWDRLVTKYRGNPQYLKLVTNTIRDIFNGKISDFLDANILIYDRIEACLSEQLDNLTNIETAVLLWLAILMQQRLANEREPVTLDLLKSKFNLSIADLELVKILDKLVKNYLIEVKDNNFTLSDLIREYIVEKYQDLIVEEIWTKKLNENRLHNYPILPSDPQAHIHGASEITALTKQYQLMLNPIIIAKLLNKILNNLPRQETLNSILFSDRHLANVKRDLIARLTEFYPRFNTFDYQNICTPPPTKILRNIFNSMQMWADPLLRSIKYQETTQPNPNKIG